MKLNLTKGQRIEFAIIGASKAEAGLCHALEGGADNVNAMNVSTLLLGENKKPNLTNHFFFLKLLFFALSFLLISTNIYSQKATPNPTVDNDCSSETSILPITSVITGLSDEKFTLVTFRYATTLFKPWISLDSKTFLTTNMSNARLQIIDWGMITEEEDDMFSSLSFDEQYFIKSRVSYDLYMVFPAIPETATLLTVQESITNGFYWRGIHINNTTTEDISKGSRDYSSRGSSGNSAGSEFTPSGSGTGFAINSDGYIATCYHVIADARAIRIKGINGNFEQSYTARVVSTDEQNDLAILKVDNTNITGVPYFWASNLSDVGEDVFVLGYPQTQRLGEELKLTTGVISSRSGYRGDITTYQVSAQVLPGNSGCPLFDTNGRVIGVVNAKYIEPNVSYAVKMSYLTTLIEKTNINLRQPVSNTFSGQTLAEKVRAVRNHIYIIEVQ